MPKPFKGLRVLDFTQVLSGPYASFQLALLGADVIKVERREGEEMRRTHLSKEWSKRGLAPYFQAINSGKRSLTLDLKRPEAIEIILRLARQVDVVIENFRPGVMDKLGIGFDRLRQDNKRLVYCGISAFGQSGPERLGAGYDGKMQAMSGIMSLTGHAETGPTRVGFAVCDVLAGATAAFAISAALFERNATGEGQLVDVSMLEATLAYMSGPIADYTIAEHVTGQAGNYSPSRKPTANLFKTGDGHLLLSVNNERQFKALMQTLGCETVLEDPKFANWYLRRDNEPELAGLIETALARKSSVEWERLLEEAGAPCARIWRLDEIIDHPQIVARGAIQSVETQFGPVRLAAAGFQLSGEAPGIAHGAPVLGQHSDEVLTELGLTAGEIAELRTLEVV